MLLRQWLQQAENALQALAQQDPHATDLAFEATRLWADVLDKNPASERLFLEQPLSDAELSRLNAALQRRASGEPLAYITGRWWFWDLELEVAPCTLIPRPDTELLVEQALALPLPPEATVLDMGTGTGAIALTLASQRPDWQVTAVDFSPDAVALAERNRSRLKLVNASVVQSDWYQAVAGKRFDLIISNPPYIDGSDPHLQQGDVRYEPLSALVAADDGLADIRLICAKAPAHLQPGGWLWLEHGHQQHNAVQQILTDAGFIAVQSRRDYGGNWRISGGSRPD
ncbi:peptide chain release factor N(5)-glutamine methyltransferase [Rheinheimera sp. F8]|uniref:peptide chain release factor N(5)-glutamine methyltransferase n=1 Tax=Rheinheimera sp. F8 TaxID=1763998 RepID=UPI000744A582|nr:peptide chain release factor N(5)-glutamine methyltransferase [Rheinheimera sp. F8]ALZ76082.1 protein-(glutamine-N5) methyltransferase, release factor-specific [Rheinheimera sp. F8]ALZ77737.1 protein-(glutamine-N5) methyltransferase, release factor-specific [Rheinheimera sp. F8]